MSVDALTQLSSAQAVTATAYSTNTYDLGVARDVGIGEPIVINITVPTTFTAAGAATMQIQVVSSANADLTSHNVLVQTDALGKSEFAAGRRPICLTVPPSLLAALPVGERYLGLRYVVATGPMTAGAVDAYINNVAIGGGKHYASGFTVA